jgi:predicted secreted hydrolase
MRSNASRTAKCVPFALVLTVLVFGKDVYRLALPGYLYEFPRDHFNHADFQTEWWYYTGNLHTGGGQRFGFELTFFRQGVDRGAAPSSVWDVRDIWMAHLALSDIEGRRFFHTERLNRAGAGLAGADLEQLRVWNGNWRAQWVGQSTQELDAVADSFSFKLSARSEKAPVVHGKNGVSQKADGEGRASHYISLTRLITTGVIELNGARYEVEGLSWMDHEFFTHQIDSNQAGWDWFSLQLTDESEIMLFRLRRKDGSADPYSAGTYIDPHGATRFLAATDFSLVPGKIWPSPSTHAQYPVEWSIRIPSLGVDAAVATRLPQQEITSNNSVVPPYWEGAIDAIGTKQGNSLIASGYLEMTGYTGKPPLAN